MPVDPSRFSCDCADFQKSMTFIVNTQAFSKSFTRSWKDSKAGVDKGQFCKHIYSTLLVRGELTKDMIPTDVPLPIFKGGEDEEGLRNKELYQPGYRGHSFENKGGFAPKKFKPYRGA